MEGHLRAGHSAAALRREEVGLRGLATKAFPRNRKGLGMGEAENTDPLHSDNQQV